MDQHQSQQAQGHDSGGNGRPSQHLPASDTSAPAAASAGSSAQGQVSPYMDYDPMTPPAHPDPSTEVPVTPGIGAFTYEEPSYSSRVPSGSRPSIVRGGAFAEAGSSRGPPQGGTAPAAPGNQTTDQCCDNTTAHTTEAMAAAEESHSEAQDKIREVPLSGNIITATFNIPYSVEHRKGSDWILHPRRGQSALVDSLSYLSSDESRFNHTVVAWTGVVETPPAMTPPVTPPATTVHLSALNQLSRPIPIDGARQPQTAPSHDGLWIPRDDMTRLEHQLWHHPRIRTVPVWLADEPDGHGEDGVNGVRLKDQARWRRYAEANLFTLFHYKQNEPADGRKERIQWADYYRMNLKFANRILEIYKPGDIVLVHDFYLMLLPSMLRQRAPHMYIAFFLHSPFPSSEFVRCLPRRKEILEGVLGANLVGFQNYSYSRHFSSCCTRILKFPSDGTGIEGYGSRVEVGVFPIGIDAAKVARQAFSPAVDEKYNLLKDKFHDVKLIVGRDRLDSVRGVSQKLEAFARFLEMYPEWHEKVVLMQVTSPTSLIEAKQESEAKVSSRVNELVMKINGRWGSLGFAPVVHYPQYLSQDEYFALLRAGDIGLITSVRDGMNTTSLEYVVCQRESGGPLILSEFSGTAGSLKHAVHINPWDYSGVAEAIHKALTMHPSDRQAMEKQLLDHVTSHNVRSWADGIVERLVSVLAHRKKSISTPLLDRASMLRQYREARRRLFMFDYDGTLTPIVQDPAAAMPSERVLHSLERLAADQRNEVWIISGRDQEFLTNTLGHIPNLGFSAEHGSFMRRPGESEWANLAETFDMGWQTEVMDVFHKYSEKCAGTFTERKRCALTWHYRKADPEHGLHMSRELTKELEGDVATRWDVEVMEGKANVEVRPSFINKGEIAKRLVKASNASGHGKVEFVLCMGDDFTDEDMFRALNALSTGDEAAADLLSSPGPANATASPGRNVEGLDAAHCFTVTVGASTKATLARWHLLEPEDVIECVALVAGVGAGGGGATSGGVLSLGEVNFGALSAVENRIPPGAVDED